MTKESEVGVEQRVLFISYNGMLEPLGQSQVLPYLRELSRRGIHLTLLSFEKPAAFGVDGTQRRQQLHNQLTHDNIDWHALRYHQTPSVPATAFDVFNGTRYARKLIRQKRIQLIHARSHIPATIGLALKRRAKIKLLFDVRGLMAEEYVEANHWTEAGIPYRLTKRVERSVMAGADGVVTLTKRIWPIIRDWEGLRGRSVPHEVIPCCADLSTFKFNAEDRTRRREELGLGKRLTLVYSGSIGSWYLSEEMTDFFVEVLRRQPDAHFLWLTTGDAALIDKIMSARGLNSTQYTVRRSESSEVPSLLSAADAGIAFYKPGLSKFATSPVKVTEYLACGLPVVINTGVGDTDEILEGSGVGVIVSEFSTPAYEQAISALEIAIAQKEMTRRRARELAKSNFDLQCVGGERYFRLYEEILKGKKSL